MARICPGLNGFQYLLLYPAIKCNSSTITTTTKTKATTTVSILRKNPNRTSATSRTLLTSAAAASSSSSTSTPFDAYKSLLTMGSCFGRCVSKEPHAAATSCLWRQQTTDDQEAELMSNTSERCSKTDNFIFRIINFKRKHNRPQFIDKFWERQDMNYDKLTTGNGTDSMSDIPLQNLDVHNLLTSTSFAKESAMNYAAGSNNVVASSRASSSLDLEWEHEYAHMMRHYSHSPPSHPVQPTVGDNKLNIQDDNRHTNLLNDDSWQFLTNDDDQLDSLNSMHSLPPTETMATTIGEQEQHERRLAKGCSNNNNNNNSSKQQNGPRNAGLTRNHSSHNSWSHISTPESLEWDIDEEQQRQLRVEDDNLDHETLELLHQIEQLKNQVLNETGDGLYENGGSGGDAGIVFPGTKCAEAALDKEVNIS